MIAVNFDSSASPANRPAASHQRGLPLSCSRTSDHSIATAQGIMRRVGRDLRHQQPVIQRGFRQQHGEDNRAHIMRHAPDDVGEQELRDQHRDDAAEPHAETGVAEDRGAEPDQPGDARADDRGRKARSPSTRSSNRPRRCADRSRRHRPAASPSAPQSAGHAQAMAGGRTVRFRLAVIGRGYRHGAFSSTPRECQRVAAEKRLIVVPAAAADRSRDGIHRWNKTI